MAHRQRRTVNTGPEDPSLLYLQRHHISQRVWDDNLNRILQTQCALRRTEISAPPPQIIEYLRQAGFYGAARLMPFDYDRTLVSALVERWRPETHTFHTTRGECSITLQDVSIQLGLPCEGLNVIGSTLLNWFGLCELLLGITPPPDKLRGQRLKLSWLQENFQELPNDATEIQVQQFTRAYILRLIGGFLMPDRSGNLVYLMYLQLLIDFKECGKYSWGSAVLANLYRELCNATNPAEINIGGCLSLLHMWAWDRFPSIAPQRPPYPDPQTHIYHVLPPLGFRWQHVRHGSRPAEHTLLRYRSFFDRMTDDEVIWQPYQLAEAQQFIPDYCFQTSEIWLASVPLICFNVIEWHHPDRVLRQFGRQQSIPRQPVCLQNIHSLELRGRTDTNWFDEHKDFINLWHGWSYSVASSPVVNENLQRNSEYMNWYWRHTRRWIQPRTGDTGCAADISERLYRVAITERETCDRDRCIEFHDQVAEDQRNILLSLREDRFNITPEPAPSATDLPRPHIAHERQSRRRRGYLSTQAPVVAEYVTTPPVGPDLTQPHYVSPPSSSHFQPPSTFDRGGPSDPSFVTPRQSISLNASPWLFDLNASSSTIQTTEPIQSDQVDAAQQQQQQPQRPQRPRRQQTRTRCGTGSHYF